MDPEAALGYPAGLEAAPMKDTTRQTGPGAYVRIKDGRGRWLWSQM